MIAPNSNRNLWAIVGLASGLAALILWLLGQHGAAFLVAAVGLLVSLIGRGRAARDRVGGRWVASGGAVVALVCVLAIAGPWLWTEFVDTGSSSVESAEDEPADLFESGSSGSSGGPTLDGIELQD